jgi:Family of unknown function (DUF6370)
MKQRATWITAAAVMLLVGWLGLLQTQRAAADDKEVKLEGTIVCAKCALKETQKCTNAIIVKENGKDVTYYFVDKGAGEDYHEEVCGGDKKPGTVTGTVSEKDGKKQIKPTKVEYKK